MIYLLDTNTCIHAINGVRVVRRQLRSRSPDDCQISAITVAELLFGALRSARPTDNQRRIESFVEPFVIEPFDEGAAAAYAAIRRDLEAHGARIGERDTLIAATAMARGLTVVTNNTSEFGRIPGLKLEDWTG